MFYQAMDALGGGILDFLAEDPPDDLIRTVREQITAQIREWSITSPLLRHSLHKLSGQTSDPELVKALLRRRPAGADLPGIILDDYYRHTVGGVAFVNRLGMLVQAVLHETANRAAAGTNPVRVLNLHISGGDELLSLTRDETFAEVAQVTCIDTRPDALRKIRRDLKGRLRRPAVCLRRTTSDYAGRVQWPAEAFDIIYGVSTFEHLKQDPALQLAVDCRILLAPDGILLAGSVTPDVPASEQILRAWLTGWELQYRDEPAWRHILTRAGFDARGVCFNYETHNANVVVSAEKCEVAT
jgi:SAM-dependent methyltransferase